MIIIDSEEKIELFSRIAQVTFEELALCGDCSVEVDFVSEDEIHELNLETRNVDRATDVLSYPALDSIAAFTQENYPFEFDTQTHSVHLGSIVICSAVAKRQAQEYGHSELRERSYLFLHGLLHLLGYDHIESEDKEEMRKVEERVLQRLGITRE